jgi:hypothetical protein
MKELNYICLRVCRVNGTIPIKETIMASYHRSNFGAFGRKIPTDRHGFTHTTIDEWMAAALDWGIPAGRCCLAHKRERCRELAQESRAAIHLAECEVQDWRASLDA